MRIVVVGGHGNFGARICRALVDEPVEIVATSRDPERGHRRAGFDGRIKKSRIDITDPHLESALRSLSPDLVIHCAGPFQGQDYRVARAALAAGAHYIDLSDGRDFVANFARDVGALAQRANRLAVSGASTVPSLSSAVVDHVRAGYKSIDEIQICIAPSQHAPRGEATLKAVFSYAGQSFRWWEGGVWRTVYGWQQMHRVEFAEMPPRWAGACDIPDLELFPARYPGVRTIQFRAALEVGLQQWLLAATSMLRQRGMSIPLDRWAVPLDRFAGFLDWFGSDRGGMFVNVTGTRIDRARGRTEWHATADNNHGPEIPCMSTILLTRKLLRKEIVKTGATPCMGLLTLDEFTPQFAHWGIRTTFREVSLAAA